MTIELLFILQNYTFLEGSKLSANRNKDTKGQ